MRLTTNLYLVPRLRMSGSTLRMLFVVCVETMLIFSIGDYVVNHCQNFLRKYLVIYVQPRTLLSVWLSDKFK